MQREQAPPPATGDPVVDDALAGAHEAAGLDLTSRLAAYEAAHLALHGRLADADTGPSR